MATEQENQNKEAEDAVNEQDDMVIITNKFMGWSNDYYRFNRRAMTMESW